MRRKTVSETSKAFGETEERCNDSIMIVTLESRAKTRWSIGQKKKNPRFSSPGEKY